MVVALKSLRVDASFDASGYARGAAQKVAADQAMIDGDRARGAALAAADAQLQKTVPGVAALSRTFITGYGSGAQFEAAVRRIGTALDRGMGLDRAQVLLEGVYRKFGQTADAAAVAERGQAGLASIVAQLNSKFAAQTEILERNAIAARRMSEAQQHQAQINARLGVNDNFGGASRAGDIEAYGRALDDTRARFVPLYAAQRAYKSELNDLNHAYATGAIPSEREYREALRRTKDAFAAQVQSLRSAHSANDNFAGSTRLSRYELINLSRQMQDVGVSLASGQSPFTVLVQQGTQIADVFAASQGTVGGFFRQTGAWLGGFLTAGRVAFGGVTSAIGLGIAALGSYLSAQQDVRRALTGIGRASGVSVGDINTIALQGASPLGQSVSEAREFASVLAATGKVGRDEIGSLVKLGHDFAVTLDVSGKEAAQSLAKAMADPVRGAEQLNERLGFMDAAMQRRIKDLVEQNRLAEAQRIIVAGIQSSIASANDVTGFWSKTWNAISNAISNSYDWLGRILSRASGVGETLEEQYARAKKRVEELAIAQQRAAQYTPSGNEVLDAQARRFQRGGNARTSIAGPSQAEMEAAVANEQRLAKAMSDRAAAAEAARLRMESFRIATAALNLLPEIEQLDRLKNVQDLLVRTMIDVQVSGGPTSEILVRLGITYEQLAAAVAKASSNVRNFKNEFEQAQQQQATQLKSLTAFSPGAKGDVAFEQRLNAELARGTEETKARALAEGDRLLAIRSVQVAMSEAARERALSSAQNVDATRLEIELIGKTIGEQTRLRADLQARQQLEQEAARNRTVFDQAQFDRLQKINAEFGEQAQLRARAEVNSQIKFDRGTMFLSETDRQIAQQLRGLYGDDIPRAIASAEAGGVRFNSQLKKLKQEGQTTERPRASDRKATEAASRKEGESRVVYPRLAAA